MSEIHETWHAIMEWHPTCRGKKIVPFGAGLGISFSQTRDSHNKPDGFGTERATFGEKAHSNNSQQRHFEKIAATLISQTFI